MLFLLRTMFRTSAFAAPFSRVNFPLVSLFLLVNYMLGPASLCYSLHCATVFIVLQSSLCYSLHCATVFIVPRSSLCHGLHCVTVFIVLGSSFMGWSGIPSSGALVLGAVRAISTKVYTISRLQRTGAFGPEAYYFEKSKRVSLSNQIQYFRSGDL
jgi:hypothetical protein